MVSIVQITIAILTFCILAFGLFFAIYRFGLNRENCTFLNLNIEANVIKHIGDLLLVSINVQLENKGQIRITARRYDDIKNNESDFLYKDDIDECKHAGTLKIRSVTNENSEKIFDWYSLKSSDYEQINYLFDYQDPKIDFKDVDYWLEPNELYTQQITLWIKPGTYFLKAYFLGKLQKYHEDEYWSCTKIVDFKKQ
jgi:hypothetical protein